MSDQQSYPPPGSPPPPGAPPPNEPAPARWAQPAAPAPGRPGAPAGPPPPPGWQPGGQPGWQPGGQPGWQPAPGMLGAAHKPGAMPLHPLSLGAIYDASFRIIRFNPKATVGSAVLVAAVAMAIPVLLTAVLTFTVGLTLDTSGTGEISDTDLLGTLVAYGSVGLASVLQSIGIIFVTGMVAHVTKAAAVGRRLSLGEAWAATHGRRWRLVGLATVLGLALTVIIAVYVVFWVLLVVLADVVVIVVVGLLSVPLFLALLTWFWIRFYYLPVPALMLERLGVLSSIGRGYRLTRDQFWRTLGIGLLTVLIAGTAAQVLSFPFSLVAQIGSLAAGEYGALVFVLGTAIAQVLSTAFVAPFSAAVTSVQYLDQRMRKEAYDVELMREAGVLDT